MTKSVIFMGPRGIIVKKQYFLCVFALVAFGAVCSAQNWSVGAGVMYQAVDDFDDGGATLAAHGSRIFGLPVGKLLLEAELTQTVVWPERELFNTSNVSVGFAEYSALTGGVYAAYSLKLPLGLLAKARVGATYVYSEIESCTVGNCQTEDDSSVNLSYGAALGYQITRRLSVLADWTQIEPDVFNVGALVRVHL